MAIKPIRLEFSFQKLLSIVDQLGTEEKLLLRKKLEKQKVSTWQERFGSALQKLGRKNIRFSEKEVVEDVKKTIAEVDFPIAEVSKHSAREKSIRHGHLSTLHL